MQASERLIEISAAFGHKLQRIVPIELDAGTLKLILYLKDGTNLRVTEQWEGKTLKRYSYYWLTALDALKIGWDNAPHHTRVDSFPHHKHVERQDNVQPSSETCLEHVMAIVFGQA